MPLKVAIYTLCLAHHTLEEAVEVAAELGYDGIEFTVGYPQAKWDGKSQWHLSLSNLEADTRRAKEALYRTGLEPVCLSTRLGYKEVDDLRGVFRAAAEMGCPQVRVGTANYKPEPGYWRLLKEAVEGWREVERLAKEFKVKALAEIHMNRIIPSASAAFNFVKHFDSRFVGVIFDPGNMAVEGYENWRMGLDILGEYLAHIHVKNPAPVRGEEGWTWEWVPLDEGVVDWREVIRGLLEVGYEGALSVEDFVRQIPGVDDPKRMERERARQDLDFLKGLISEGVTSG
ncbi:MAG TPA: sugar phosphate isomerase/epimerase [Armatimonadetes bacterium]|nr:sugar phosphate isomerase/epimerase [Armatimonadota bacterium]